MHHTLRRHWVTPDASAPAIPHNENRKRVVRCVLRLPKKTAVHRDSRNLFCLLRLRGDFVLTQRKSPATNTRRAPAPKWHMRDVVRFHFGLAGPSWCRHMFQFLCLLCHILIKTHRNTFIDAHIHVCFGNCDWTHGRTCRSFGYDSSRGANRSCEVCFTTPHGSTKTPLRSKMRFLRFERTSSMKGPSWFSGCSTIRFPAATTLHAATKGLCSLSMTLNFKLCTSPF